MPHSGVQLKCDRGGGVTVFCGSTEIGQGSDSILAYIVAEVLGLDPFDIAVVTADTDLTPVDLGSYSSRVTLMTGNAAIQAAERAREILAGHAARKLEIPAARVVFADGRVFDADDPKRGMAFAAACSSAGAPRRWGCATSSPIYSRIPIPAGPSAPRRSVRGRCSPCHPRSPTRCTTPWGSASTRSRSHRRRCSRP